MASVVLGTIVDVIEEQLLRGKMRWLATFKEIYKNRNIGNLNISLYAKGSYRERGFLVSRIFSALFLPKRSIHFLAYTTKKAGEGDVNKLLNTRKKLKVDDDWFLISIVQEESLDPFLRRRISRFGERETGILAYSLKTSEIVRSDNALGKAMAERLNLRGLTFEAFDMADYVKSVGMVFVVGIIAVTVTSFINLLIALRFFAPVPILSWLAASMMVGYTLYRRRYHCVLTLSERGFSIKKGKDAFKGAWKDFQDALTFVDDNGEEFVRLIGRDESVDLPTSRVGISRHRLLEVVEEFVKTTR